MMVVSYMSSGALSVALSERPTEPNTLSTSGFPVDSAHELVVQGVRVKRLRRETDLLVYLLAALNEERVVGDLLGEPCLNMWELSPTTGC
jgi:hypothetical protein